MTARPVLLALLVVSGVLPEAGLAQARTMRPRMLAEVGGISPEGDPLLLPLRAVADDSTIYVFDNGDHSLKAFDWHGRPRWTLGRQGAGPGEFAVVTGFTRAADGRLWVSDAGNARVIVVSPAGEVERQIRPARVLMPGGAVPLADGGFLAQTLAAGPFLARFDAQGVFTRALEVPPDLVGRSVLEAHMVGDISEGYPLFGALQGDRFYVVSPTGDAVRGYRGVQPMEFPKWQATKVAGPRGAKVDAMRPVPGNLSGVLSVVRQGGELMVLIGSAAEPSHQVVDVYDFERGKYRESFLLPGPCNTLASVGHRLVCMRLNPVPTVLIWEPGRARPTR